MITKRNAKVRMRIFRRGLRLTDSQAFHFCRWTSRSPSETWTRSCCTLSVRLLVRHERCGLALTSCLLFYQDKCAPWSHVVLRIRSRTLTLRLSRPSDYRLAAVQSLAYHLHGGAIKHAALVYVSSFRGSSLWAHEVLSLFSSELSARQSWPRLELRGRRRSWPKQKCTSGFSPPLFSFAPLSLSVLSSRPWPCFQSRRRGAWPQFQSRRRGG